MRGFPGLWFYLIVGLILLERGADAFADAVGELMERTGASETVVGLLTAGIEWEELVVCSVAALSGNAAVALGDVLGSNIANLTGSFSLGLLARPVEVCRDDRWFALVAAFSAYIEGARHAVPDFDRGEGRRLGFLMAFLGLGLTVLGAEAVVRSAVYFAHLLRASDFVIGLTLVAVGTTLPDKVISVVSALRGRSGVVIGNAVGSNIFNILFVLGVTASVQPLGADGETAAFDLPFLVCVSALICLLFLRRQLHIPEGLLLLGLYAFYIYYNFAVK
ncbi:MAG: sodium:calcium antiporter [bacterium]